ncbi:MAG TPA: ceramidase domain-containing protein [Pseudolabrys sp.]|nr:ceramidase domain-containing protein [Pseudolabrys sp.]
MEWSRSVDIYCERTDPSFWAEPVNAISNAAFLIAALIVFIQWRRANGRDLPLLALIALTFVIGIGSFIFHTVATQGAELFDTVPIAVFIYAYLFLALRRFLGLRPWTALGLWVGFAAFTFGEAALVPADTLNGSHAYLPALAATLIVGWFARDRAARPLILAAGGTLAGSLFFRGIDMAVCSSFPLGTHFIWHCLNAVVLYLLLRAGLIGQMRSFPYTHRREAKAALSWRSRNR